MKKAFLATIACMLAFGIGLVSPAFCEDGKLKIAYVNVEKLLASSKAIKAAETARAKQTEEMLKWYNTASADIQKQKTQEGKQALVKKYEAQLTAKKKSIKDAYAKKISEVDSQLDSVITQKAKDMGYDIVLRKESVLYGAVDITNSILPLVK